jgi:hypothetical protein
MIKLIEPKIEEIIYIYILFIYLFRKFKTETRGSSKEKKGKNHPTLVNGG